MPLIAGGLLMMTPEARADWVIVSLQGDIEITEKTKVVGGDFQGSPQKFSERTTYGTRMTVGRRGYQAAPSSGGSSSSGSGYGGGSSGSGSSGGGSISEGGSAMVVATGSNFKVGLEWQGTEPPTKICYLRVGSEASVDISNGLRAWSLSAATGIAPRPDIGPQTDDRSKPNTSNSYDYAAYNPLSRMYGYKIIPIDTGGKTSCTQEISISPTATGTVTAKAYDMASATAGVSASAEISLRGVSISSNLEPSWKKYVGSFSSLPDAYKQHNSVDDVGDTPNDKAVQVAGANTPDDTSDDVWRIRVLRDGQGKIEVHSAARWFPTRDVPADMWLGGVNFRANQEGFNFPTYSWTEASGGKTTGGLTFESLIYPAVPPSYTDSYYGIKLGTQRNGSDLNKSSSVSVDVEDGEGKLSDSYDVKWHLPWELGATLGDRLTTSLVPKSFRLDGGIMSPTLNPGQRGEFATNQITVDVKAGAEVWGLVGDLATSIVGEIPVIGLPGELLLTTAGWQLGQVPDPQWNPTRHELGFWRDAVNAQRQINQGLATGIRRIDPPYLADDALALDPDTTKPNHPWRRCKMSLILQSDITQRSYELDKYAGDGYVGPGIGELPLAMTVTHEIYSFTQSQ